MGDKGEASWHRSVRTTWIGRDAVLTSSFKHPFAQGWRRRGVSTHFGGPPEGHVLPGAALSQKQCEEGGQHVTKPASGCAGGGARLHGPVPHSVVVAFPGFGGRGGGQGPLAAGGGLLPCCAQTLTAGSKTVTLDLFSLQLNLNPD